MAGLFSSLALSSAVASQIVMGVQAPPAPSIEDQHIAQEIVQDSNSAVARSDSNNQSSTSEHQSSQAEKQEKSRDNGAENLSQILTDDSTTISEDNIVHGIDISSHQHTSDSNINIKEATSNGQDFGFVKATEGDSYTNPNFRSDVIGFKKNNTPVGFYHYAIPSDDLNDAKNQAQRFIYTTGLDKGVKSFDPVLDIEEGEGLTPGQLQSWVGAFVDEVKSLSGRDTMIYTYQNFWRENMGNTEEFNHLPLWIADYNDQATPNELPGGWDTWTFWQYSAKGSIIGYGKDIDVNVYNGNKNDMTEMYKSVNPKKVGSDGKTTVTRTVVVIPQAPSLN